jgi:pSer/pThr/pTyr-binding forkhead associated (FHA) protein
MKKRLVFLAFAGVLICSILTSDVYADQEWISDILANPSRYWNRTVTIIGDVQTVIANPPGTTRGTYTVLDDSGTVPITVQTKDLPPIGRTYSVTGVIIQDPNQANVPLMREIKRASPGLDSNLKLLLIGGGALFLILLIVFIVLLAKPKKQPGLSQTVRPATRPVPPPPPPSAPAPDMTKTTKIPSAGAPAAASPDKTQVFMSLGADVVVEKGPEKGKEFALSKQVSTIGRPGTRKNDIELNDDTVSKTQASIFFDNTTKNFTVSNESTTNPTKVNGQMIQDVTSLNNGDLIEMGRSVLKFVKQ